MCGEMQKYLQNMKNTPQSSSVILYLMFHRKYYGITNHLNSKYILGLSNRSNSNNRRNRVVLPQIKVYAWNILLHLNVKDAC